MLSDIGSQKDKNWMIPLIQGPQSSQSHKDRKQNVAARDWDGGSREAVLNGTER